MQEESFDYEDVVHVKVASGRSLLYGLVGAAVLIGGLVMAIQSILLAMRDRTNRRTCTQRELERKIERSCASSWANTTQYSSCYATVQDDYYRYGCYVYEAESRVGVEHMFVYPILVMVLGCLFLGYFASGNRKAFVTLDMTKDKEVGSFQPPLVSYETIMNPFSVFSRCLGKLRRHVTRELSFQKKDAFAATAKICAIRQGLKEKLAGANRL
jgi:hypothetical protein